jgi:tetratricopeptide (TPR) repeat protein
MVPGVLVRMAYSQLTLALALGICSVLRSSLALAQVPISAPSAAAGNETGEAGARKHFDRALELYRAGQYDGALEQLDQAAALDPDGKDLFFNLALVHEKLGQLAQAIAALERFRELETDQTERQRAKMTIERLRGAEKAAEIARATSSTCAPVATPATPAPKISSPVLIATASVAVVSLVVAALFGAKALADDVGNERTSAAFSLAQLRERGQRAQREALVADIALAVGAASAGTCVGVWLLTPGEPTRRAAGITLRSYF